MSQNAPADLSQKIPINLILVLVLGYFGYDFYNFHNDPASALVAKKNEITQVKSETEAIQKKLKERQEFLRGLEVKKAELRRLSAELEGMKATLSYDLDVPSFMKMTFTEAKKVGITINGMVPKGREKREYYSEQPYGMGFRGVYVQLLVLLDRLAQSQKIIRVDNFNFKTKGSSSAKHVEVEGTLQLKAYAYVGSKADEIAKSDSAASSKPTGAPQTAPASAPKAGGA